MLMNRGLAAQNAMHYRLGTCGFSYDDWVGTFYPRDLRHSGFLAFYARYFDAVELDTTFHATPEPHIVQRWAAATPDDFRFCPKTPASVTHGARIDEQLAPMLWFLEVMRGLGDKLGVVLLQFPPSFTFAQFDRLAGFLPRLPTDVRYAVEFRNPTWQRNETTALLSETNTCWAVGDYADDPTPVRVTTDFLYVRWIGVHQRFNTLTHEQIDTTEKLAWWKSQFDHAPAKVQTTWGFFNNDYAGNSIGTANRLRKLAGLEVREPKAEDRGELFG